ncbi:SUKH-4 family immunity protein [Kitasatospora sp. NPDC001574]
MLLDGASGAVHLACTGDDGVLQRDLLATGPHALIALVTLVEAITVCAAGGYEPDEGDTPPPYGPRTADAAVRLGLQEMREADPELWERTDGRPAHWEAALQIRALAWGAEAGKPGELAYRVGPELVEDLAAMTGGGTVRRFSAADLPDTLVHGPTRSLLADVGLPVAPRCMLGVDAADPLATMAQTYPAGYADHGGEPSSRHYQGEYAALGGWMYDLEVALDGTTGAIELPDWLDDDQPAPYLHRDVATLLYVLWTYERLRTERRRWVRPSTPVPWAVFRPRDLFDSAAEDCLRALDPPAWATESHFWPVRVDDCHMGELLD